MSRAGAPDPRRRLRRLLEAQRWTGDGRARFGLAYDGPADFVLRHGEEFDPRPCPPEVPAGAPRACFGNALAVAVLYGLEYVEGWALAVDGDALIYHAWNADAGGGLYDTTWSPVVGVGNVPGRGLVLVRGRPGAAYLGVRFSVERADDATWNGDAAVLEDGHRGYPLLREPWAGEPADASWPASYRLEALRLRRDGHDAEAIAAFRRGYG